MCNNVSGDIVGVPVSESSICKGGGKGRDKPSRTVVEGNRQSVGCFQASTGGGEDSLQGNNGPTPKKLSGSDTV